LKRFSFEATSAVADSARNHAGVRTLDRQRSVSTFSYPHGKKQNCGGGNTRLSLVSGAIAVAVKKRPVAAVSNRVHCWLQKQQTMVPCKLIKHENA
jgi:hypothetical protein